MAGKKYQFPINNAATENAIHGFVRDEAFEVDFVFLAKDHASILCSFTYEGQREYYPFPFTLEIEFMLHDNGTFTVEVACRNLHNQAIPFGFGWHPYFRLTERVDDHLLQLPSCEKVAIQERMIPTGERTAFSDFQRKKRLGEDELEYLLSGRQSGGQCITTIGTRRTTAEGAGQRPAIPLFSGLYAAASQQRSVGANDL